MKRRAKAGIAKRALCWLFDHRMEYDGGGRKLAIYVCARCHTQEIRRRPIPLPRFRNPRTP